MRENAAWTVVRASGSRRRRVGRAVLLPVEYLEERRLLTALPTLSVASATAVAGQVATFDVTLSQATTSDVTFQWISDELGDASLGDYDTDGGFATIPAGSTTGSFGVATYGDSMGRTSESFGEQLSGLSSNAVFAGGQSVAYAGGIILPTVGTGAVLVNLTGSLLAVSAGGSTTLTATVASGTDGAVPTGTITLNIGGTASSTVPLVNGLAQITPALSSGANTFTVTYSGDPNYTNLDSNPVVVLSGSADATTSTTVVTSSATSVDLTAPVTFTATVAPTIAGGPTPVGEVTFYDGGNVIQSDVPLVDGAATASSSTLISGTHSITAYYIGDDVAANSKTSNYVSSTSVPFSQAISALAVTSTTVDNIDNPVTYQGYNTTFLVRVVSANATGPLPTGDVTLFNGTTSLGTEPLAAGEYGIQTAEFNISTFPVGTSTVTASYGGDSANDVSTSTPQTITIMSLNGGGGGTTGGTGTGLVPTFLDATVPAAVIGGSKLHAKLNSYVSNTSGALEKGYTAKVFASTDTTLDGSDTLVATVVKPSSIKAGRTGFLPIPLSGLPAALPDGTYNLIIETIDSAGNTAMVVDPTTVTIAAPFVSLAQSVTSTLPAAVVSGSATKGNFTIIATNNGNVPSKGLTTLNLTASTVSGVLGTSVGQFSKNVTILPGKSAKIVFSIKSIPALADGDYFLVGQLTSPFNDTTSIGSTAVTINAAAPFVSLAPIFSSVIKVSTGGTATAVLTITNNGNTAPVGNSQVLLFASGSPSIVGATQLLDESIALPIKPGKSKTLKIHLTSAMVQEIQNPSQGALDAQVIDPMGGSMTTFTDLTS